MQVRTWCKCKSGDGGWVQGMEMGGVCQERTQGMEVGDGSGWGSARLVRWARDHHVSQRLEPPRAQLSAHQSHNVLA
jgi:hypothetical protein